VELSGRCEERVEEVSAVVDGLGRQTWWKQTFLQEGERKANGDLEKLLSMKISK
jgi:hypothetical protein